MILAVVITGALVAVVFAWFGFEVRAAARPAVTADDVNAAGDMWAGACQKAASFKNDCGCRIQLTPDGTPHLAPCPAHEAIAEIEASRETM